VLQENIAQSAVGDRRGCWLERHLDLYRAGPEGEGTSVAVAVALVGDAVALGEGVEDGALAGVQRGREPQRHRRRGRGLGSDG